LLVPFLEKIGIHAQPGEFLVKVVRTLVQRSKTLEEMASAAAFYFTETIIYEEKAARKFLKPDNRQALHLLVDALSVIETFTEENLENAFKSVMEKTGLKLGKIAQPVRVALTGKTASPGIFEITEIIGKEKVIHRLKQAVEFIDQKTVK
jgi:glutamyl-tRNA synthetase